MGFDEVSFDEIVSPVEVEVITAVRNAVCDEVLATTLEYWEANQNMVATFQAEGISYADAFDIMRTRDPAFPGSPGDVMFTLAWALSTTSRLI